MLNLSKVFVFLIVFLTCHLSPFTCQLFAKDKIIAVVNNEIITQKDLNDFTNFMRIQLSKEYKENELEAKIQSLKTDLVTKLIEDRLILQEAKKNDSKIEVRPGVSIDIKPDENRIKAKINEIKKYYPSDSEFQKDLARQGQVQADLEKRIREQFLMYNIIEHKIRDKIVISPDEVTKFYEQNIKKLISPEVRELEVITLENEDLARTFSYNLRTGQKLEDLATRYPISVNKIRVTKEGELAKNVEEVVFNLGIGEISAPIKIDDKYYVFKLENISPPRQLTLSEAQDKIYAFLFEEKLQQNLSKWVDELKAQSYIKIF
ncbi:MAG: peptidyl-prolyl cis-trans isomerase [Candidatus Omnitrophica bacterium]|nr:peptidyl-prolyl cis-trans isomerase [Candidatus Omnitrophota bacterium]